jgi:DHA2 family multidrug resistance protein-like MFS transporter
MTAQDRRRWWALGALAVSVLAVGLDLTVLNLALPALASSLHAGTGDLQWFIDAYSLVLAAALLPAGLAGDRLGRRKVLTGSLALFGAASLACAYATSSGELIAARAVLGLSAAAILPLALAVIPVMFTPAEQPRAIALLGGMTFLGYPVGPILGGWLLDHFWWGSVFLINVPVAVIAVVAVAVLMPESRSEERPRLDLAGILVSAVGLSALTYGVIKAGQDGWGDPAAVATMAAGAVALCVFVRLELRLGRAGRQPLADLTLFRSARFGWGTALATLVSFTLFGVLFGIPLYFRDVRGLDSLGSGLRLVPLMAGMGAGLVAGQKLQSPGRGGAAPRVSVRALVTVGLVIMAAGLAAGAGTTVSSGAGFTVAWLAATGLGLGLALPAMLGAALSALSKERSGSGSALITASRQVGAALGVAGLGTLLSAVYRDSLVLPQGLPAAGAEAVRSGVTSGVAVAHAVGSDELLASVRSAYTTGLDALLWCGVGIAVLSALAAAVFLPGRRAGSTAADAGEPEVAGGASARPAGAVQAE